MPKKNTFISELKSIIASSNYSFNDVPEEVIPVFEKAPEVTRILASKVKKDINGCVMDYVIEVWVGNQSEWYKVAVEDTKSIPKPAWAQQDQFPYLKPYHNIICACVSDFTMSNNLKNYHGYMPMR